MAVSLDAVKAFNRAWREIIFYQMKKKQIDLIIIILFKIYYDKLKSKVKLNNEYSDTLTLKRGVKQACILSPALFNNVKIAKFMDILLDIFGFADDHTLLGTNFDETQQLLNIRVDFRV